MELCARALHQADTPWVSLEHPEKLSQAPLEILEQAQYGIFFTGEIADLTNSAQKGLILGGILNLPLMTTVPSIERCLQLVPLGEQGLIVRCHVMDDGAQSQPERV